MTPPPGHLILRAPYFAIPAMGKAVHISRKALAAYISFRAEGQSPQTAALVVGMAQLMVAMLRATCQALLDNTETGASMVMTRVRTYCIPRFLSQQGGAGFESADAVGLFASSHNRTWHSIDVVGVK